MAEHHIEIAPERILRAIEGYLNDLISAYSHRAPKK
jgi:hypothetical protein